MKFLYIIKVVRQKNNGQKNAKLTFSHLIKTWDHSNWAQDFCITTAIQVFLEGWQNSRSWKSQQQWKEELKLSPLLGKRKKIKTNNFCSTLERKLLRLSVLSKFYLLKIKKKCNTGSRETSNFKNSKA